MIDLLDIFILIIAIGSGVGAYYCLSPGDDL